MDGLADQDITATLTVPGHEPVQLTRPKEEEMSTLLDRPQQLSFDIGGDVARPTGASLKITGSGDIRSQLFMGDDIMLRVVDSAGEVVAELEGSCSSVAFKQHDASETEPEWVERIHTIKLGDRVDEPT